MSRYILHLAQVHETFRKPELEALASLFKLDLKILQYNENRPFAIISLPSDDDARKLVKRSLLTKSIYEYWGSAVNYSDLHAEVKAKTRDRWNRYQTCSFRFDVECYRGLRTPSEQKDIIEQFSYVGFDGPIKMKNPDETFQIMEEYDLALPPSSTILSKTLDTEKKGSDCVKPHLSTRHPIQIYFGRLLGTGGRSIVDKYDLKKRKYIGTTSMEAELSLVTANMAQAAPGKLAYDPFVGTGSFAVACSHFGAMSFGSDIDGRTIRGSKGRSLLGNFEQYNMVSRHLDSFVSDLTNNPFRRVSSASDQFLDAIICDPPYGVREGLKVLGSRDQSKPKEPVMKDGLLVHLQSDYIPPKRPYSFDAMLADILEFAVLRLVPDGRLCMWMPTANDDFSPLAIPSHPKLELVSVCVQDFNRWARRLLTYRRLRNEEAPQKVELNDNVSQRSLSSDTASLQQLDDTKKQTADDLNSFRRKYFQGFKAANGD